jgi:hypothetical protein
MFGLLREVRVEGEDVERPLAFWQVDDNDRLIQAYPAEPHPSKIGQGDYRAIYVLDAKAPKGEFPIISFSIRDRRRFRTLPMPHPGRYNIRMFGGRNLDIMTAARRKGARWAVQQSESGDMSPGPYDDAALAAVNAFCSRLGAMQSSDELAAAFEGLKAELFARQIDIAIVRAVSQEKLGGRSHQLFSSVAAAHVASTFASPPRSWLNLVTIAALYSDQTGNVDLVERVLSNSPTSIASKPDPLSSPAEWERLTGPHLARSMRLWMKSPDADGVGFFEVVEALPTEVRPASVEDVDTPRLRVSAAGDLQIPESQYADLPMATTTALPMLPRTRDALRQIAGLRSLVGGFAARHRP